MRGPVDWRVAVSTRRTGTVLLIAVCWWIWSALRWSVWGVCWLTWMMSKALFDASAQLVRWSIVTVQARREIGR